MRQLLAFGALMVICAMIGAFLTDVKRDMHTKPSWVLIGDSEVHVYRQPQASDVIPVDTCAKWAPMDAHPGCHWERCPSVENETQMVCW